MYHNLFRFPHLTNSVIWNFLLLHTAVKYTFICIVFFLGLLIWLSKDYYFIIMYVPQCSWTLASTELYYSFYPTLISKRVATIKSIFHEYKNEEFYQFVSSWHFCSLIFERGNVAYWATDRWGNQFQRGFRLDLDHNLLFFNLLVSQIPHVRNEDRVGIASKQYL